MHITTNINPTMKSSGSSSKVTGKWCASHIAIGSCVCMCGVSGSDDESEEDSDDDSDWEESDEESESEMEGYDLDICPPGCDQVRLYNCVPFCCSVVCCVGV